MILQVPALRTGKGRSSLLTRTSSTLSSSSELRICLRRRREIRRRY